MCYLMMGLGGSFVEATEDTSVAMEHVVSPSADAMDPQVNGRVFRRGSTLCGGRLGAKRWVTGLHGLYRTHGQLFNLRSRGVIMVTFATYLDALVAELREYSEQQRVLQWMDSVLSLCCVYTCWASTFSAWLW